MFPLPAPDADKNSFCRALMACLGASRGADQGEALFAFVGTCLRVISPEQIAAIRAQFVHAFGADSELVELIDGHLMLRELTRAE
jgi:hypothetical protein